MMESEEKGLDASAESGPRSGVTRRRALQVGAAVGAAGVLSACGGSSSGSSSGSTTTASKALIPGAVPELPGGTPKMGGTFTVGLLTSGSSENVWPGTASTLPDWARQYSLYSFLLYPGVDMAPLVPGLATSWEP